MATKCSNCNNDAMYEYKLTLKTSVFYCGKDLPKFLESRKKALLLTTTDAYAQAKEEALSALVLPSSVIEVEEAPAEEPKKRATKKKAK